MNENEAPTLREAALVFEECISEIEGALTVMRSMRDAILARDEQLAESAADLLHQQKDSD